MRKRNGRNENFEFEIEPNVIFDMLLVPELVTVKTLVKLPPFATSPKSIETGILPNPMSATCPVT